ncbi:hypothetical protein D0Z07_8692 [Hyphodiscus hymeniophilus]|uniref:DUF218 domain-containing protein n=1 Tax=Hyphodiscus hymeniophilus TaxID=353542 RepID=A0A9P6VE07_9HELO|nr:hypothetical protein D0Z07_8692 [Hyphodiscus hymeniophilus]
MSLTASVETASDINLLASFLAHGQKIQDLQSHLPVDCIIICASAVLYQAEELFRILQAAPSLTKTVVLCGGNGHSTSLMWDAVAKSSRFSSLGSAVRGKPEARVLEDIMNKYFDIKCFETGDCKLLIEDKSTNCGANALYSRRLLEASGVSALKTCVVIQDPTMALRTIASFEKAYEDLDTRPKFLSCPLFIPQVRLVGSKLEYAVTEVPRKQLWEFERFMELVLGEIPRLRDDGEGYGPNGKGFITHVSIPTEVEDSWARLGTVGLTFLGFGGGSLSGLAFFAWSSDYIIKKKPVEADVIAVAAGLPSAGMKPGYRLSMLIPDVILVPIDLLLYGWTAKFHVHWMVPIMSTTFIEIANMAVFICVSTYLIDAFTVYAASALATNTVVRSVASAVLPLAGQKMYNALGLGWGNSLLAFIALALVPISWILLKYGEPLRKRFEINNP